jgi:hypothetical protein
VKSITEDFLTSLIYLFIDRLTDNQGILFMKTRLLAALLVTGAIAAPAFADGDHDYPPVIAGHATTMSRADVKAALVQARAAGQLEFSQASYPALRKQPQSDGLTRAHGTAELAHAREAATDQHS